MPKTIIACRRCRHFIEDGELCREFPQSLPNFVDGTMEAFFPMVIMARSLEDLCGQAARGYSPNSPGIALAVDNEADRR